MKQILTIVFLLSIFVFSAQANANNRTVRGDVVSVRTYQLGDDGLRAQITLSEASHECGTDPSVFYFDTGNVNTEVVKSVLSLAFGAMVSGKQVKVTYDCSLSEGGYGWGIAISVFN